MNRQEIVLSSVIRESKKHLLRINHAYHKILPLLPFTKINVDELHDDEVEHLDQYIFRFSKLQETIGQKLFHAVLLVQGEEVHNKSFLDIFNRLEQLGIVTNYDLWNELRVLRNEVAHEYDEDPKLLADKLNEIIRHKETLEKYLNDIEGYLKGRGYKF
jgi:hypothetical protein